MSSSSSPSPTSAPSLTDDRDNRRYTPSPIARPRSNSTLTPIAEIQPQPQFLRFPPAPSHDYSSNSHNSIDTSSSPSSSAHTREFSAPLPSSAARSIGPVMRARRLSQSIPHPPAAISDFSSIHARVSAERTTLIGPGFRLPHSRQQSSSASDHTRQQSSSDHTRQSSSSERQESEREDSLDTASASTTRTPEGGSESSIEIISYQHVTNSTVHKTMPEEINDAPSRPRTPQLLSLSETHDSLLPKVWLTPSIASPIGPPGISAITLPGTPTSPATSPSSTIQKSSNTITLNIAAPAFAPSTARSASASPPIAPSGELASASTVTESGSAASVLNPSPDPGSAKANAQFGGSADASVEKANDSISEFERISVDWTKETEEVTPERNGPTSASHAEMLSVVQPSSQLQTQYYTHAKSQPQVLSLSQPQPQPQSHTPFSTQTQLSSSPSNEHVTTSGADGHAPFTLQDATAAAADAQVKTPNVYINGLPPHFPDEQLYMITKEFGGVVSVRTFTRHVGERLSGYGFVLFETIEAAEACIEKLSKYRNLHPSFSKQVHKIPGTTYASNGSASVPPRSNANTSVFNNNNGTGGNAGSIWRPPSTVSDSNSHAGTTGSNSESFRARMERLSDINSTNLYIEGLPLSINEESLSVLIEPHPIKSSRFFQTKLSDPPRMIAFVRLETRKAAEEIIERLHGRVVRGFNDNGSRVSVRFADSNEQRELRRSERVARGDEDDSSASNRLSMAHAALLNMRGAQLQAQLQVQLTRTAQSQGGAQQKANVFLPNACPISDDFGRISSTAHVPLHPQTTYATQVPSSLPTLPTASGIGLGTGVGVDQSLQYQAQLTQAQEYARLLETTMRGMGISLGDMDLNGMNSLGMGFSMDSPLVNSPADQFALLQNQQYSQLVQQQGDHTQRQPKGRNAAGRHGQRPLMPSLDTQNNIFSPEGFAQYTGTTSFVPQNQNQQQLSDQQQVHRRAFDTPMKQYESSLGTLQAQSFGGGGGVRGSASSNARGFGSGLSAQYGQDSHGLGLGTGRMGGYGEHGGETPLVSPALTYASRTPSTMSPATPFFGGFTPALGERDRRKGEFQQ
ncbi:hypothetical protein BD410DRAFT_838030 [Rickenella mellea]|uniref:RRM domain-containing protein n=1 Tax=Rickenella mellea TaxID=50990 RepID=A0A4Y7QBQ1_9AGAM|nr:hypothetical protein BD410DRAFT_838030 [Rickenella mellea]